MLLLETRRAHKYFLFYFESDRESSLKKYS